MFLEIYRKKTERKIKRIPCNVTEKIVGAVITDENNLRAAAKLHVKLRLDT